MITDFVDLVWLLTKCVLPATTKMIKCAIPVKGKL